MTFQSLNKLSESNHLSLFSPSEKLSEAISIENGETPQVICIYKILLFFFSSKATVLLTPCNLEFPAYDAFLTLLLVPHFLPVISVLTHAFFPAQIACSDSPSPPPGLAKPCLVVPASVAGLTVLSPFEGAGTESQSLFSDNSNFRHPNPIPSSSSVPGFPSSTQSNADWPTAPEPQSLFTSG